MKKYIKTSINEYLNKHNDSNLNDNFWKWFGASKIVDKNGEPLVVNHGSKNKFNVFDLNIDQGENSNSISRVGFWFSSSKDFAMNFAKNIWYGEGKEVFIYHVFLSMKNPKIYVSGGDDIKMEKIRKEVDIIQNNIEDISSKWSYVFNRKEHEAFEMASSGKINDDNKEYYSIRTEQSEEAIKDGLTVLGLNVELKKLKDEFYDLNYSYSFEKFKTDIYKMAGKNANDANFAGIGKQLEDSKETIKKYITSLKSEGYDGIIIKKTSFDKKYAGGVNDQYIVFNSNQIKSVKNDGSFDIEDPNIFS